MAILELKMWGEHCRAKEKLGYRTFRRNRFDDAGSATGRFGDSDCKCFIQKKRVFEILHWLDYKGCLLDMCVCCHPEGQRGSPSTGSLEELSATVTTCGRKYGL